MPTERACERCGRKGILLPICGPCQRDLAHAEGRVDPPAGDRHGTVYAYKGGNGRPGCRCLECKAAWAERGLENYHKAKAQPPRPAYPLGDSWPGRQGRLTDRLGA